MKEIKDRKKKTGLALDIGNRLQGISEPQLDICEQGHVIILMN